MPDEGEGVGVGAVVGGLWGNKLIAASLDSSLKAYVFYRKLRIGDMLGAERNGASEGLGQDRVNNNAVFVEDILLRQTVIFPSSKATK